MKRSEVIRQRIRDLEAELATLDAFGDDQFAQGTVIRWRKQFSPGARKYTYAALKVGRCWYLTDREGRELTWEGLVEKLNSDGVSKVRVSTSWHRVVGAGVKAPVRTPDPARPKGDSGYGIPFDEMFPGNKP